MFMNSLESQKNRDGWLEAKQIYSVTLYECGIFQCHELLANESISFYGRSEIYAICSTGI